jgi:hypothetical protein
VSYDAMLVADLAARFVPRLRSTPHWSGSVAATPVEPAEHATALERTSRVVMILHQRLWRHDRVTATDEAALRSRLRARPKSVRVVTLDGDRVPEWLAGAPRCSLGKKGLDGVVEFALEAVTACGGSVQPPAPAASAPTPLRWGDTPVPFLAQPRAFSSLRREIDALAAALRVGLDGFDKTEQRSPEGVAELQTLPHRLVAQLGAVGLTFSWVAGRLASVADGRLLVIEWKGVLPSRLGVPAKAAAAVRETVYRPEATGPDGWRWRADEPGGRAYSTKHLAGAWLLGASVSARA